jgi:tRNA (mo5U34)-methyltransferase
VNGSELKNLALAYVKKLDAAKAAIDPEFPWYPYGSLSNFITLEPILNRWSLERLNPNHSRMVDIGAADGDLAFFLEDLGYGADILDYGPTNFNNLRGARLLKAHMNSTVNIYNVDLDDQFTLPTGAGYDLAFFLGILYHLKNPFYTLERLSKASRYLILSTRVARLAPDGTSLEDLPVAYLLSPRQTNDDPSNYWIFSQAGLRRLFDRTGWEELELTAVGDTRASNPQDADHDERVFALLESRVRKT